MHEPTQVVPLAGMVLFCCMHRWLLLLLLLLSSRTAASPPGAPDAPQPRFCCDGHSCCPAGCLGHAFSASGLSAKSRLRAHTVGADYNPLCFEVSCLWWGVSRREKSIASQTKEKGPARSIGAEEHGPNASFIHCGCSPSCSRDCLLQLDWPVC